LKHRTSPAGPVGPGGNSRLGASEVKALKKGRLRDEPRSTAGGQGNSFGPSAPPPGPGACGSPCPIAPTPRRGTNAPSSPTPRAGVPKHPRLSRCRLHPKVSGPPARLARTTVRLRAGPALRPLRGSPRIAPFGGRAARALRDKELILNFSPRAIGESRFTAGSHVLQAHRSSGSRIRTAPPQRLQS